MSTRSVIGLGVMLVALLFCLSPVAAQEKSADLEQRIKDAVELYESGQTEQGIYLLQQVLKEDPDNTRVLRKLGEMAVEQQNWAYAIEVLRKAADLLPQDIEVRQLLMEVYRAYEMPVEEIKAGQEILAIKPDHVSTLRRLAQVYEMEGMVDDEEKTRYRLLELAPQDYPNAERLAVLLEQRKATDEAAEVRRLIAERFPDRVEDRAALARLAGEQGNRYREMRHWEEVRSLPGGDTAEVGAAYERAYAAQKAQAHRADWIGASAGWLESSGPIDRITEINGQLGYTRVFLLDDRELGILARYRHLDYHPRAFVRGDRGVTGWGLMGRWRESWNRDEVVLVARAGFENVSVTGNTTAISKEDVNNTNAFPFLEQRSYGGTRPVADITVTRMVTPTLRLRGYVVHQLVPDLHAYVRNITRTGPGGSLDYTFPSGTIITGQAEYMWFSDGNRRTVVSAGLRHPLIGPQGVYDREGNRVGELGPVDNRLDLYYVATYTDDSRLSPLYVSAPNGDLGHAIGERGEHRLGGSNAFFFHEFSVGLGSDISNLTGGQVGVLYRDPESGDFWSLGYFRFSEKVDQAQLNPALQGDFTNQGILLNGVFHFDTTPPAEEGETRAKYHR